MSGNVWIAGGGVICGIGTDLQACLEAFAQMQPGMQDMQYLRSIHRGVLPVAEVKADNAALAARAGMPEHISRTARAQQNSPRRRPGRPVVWAHAHNTG